MKIVIAGGAGQLGQILARDFHASGDEVVVLSRVARATPWRTVAWDARTPGDWIWQLNGADAMINLAGASVNCRYTPWNRRKILESRLLSTRIIGDVIARSERPPRVWLQASSATIYSHRFDEPNDEMSGLIGGSEPDAPRKWLFSIQVATEWERAAFVAETPQTRKVLMRTAIVLSPDPGGIFDVLLRLVRYGLGGHAGNGRQYVSWVHDRDFVRAVRFLIANDDVQDAVNIASPEPLSNADFMRVLREVWGAKYGLSAPKPLLELGALLMWTESELVLKSRRVVPARLESAGFTFDYPSWPEAARDLVGRWRTRG